MGQIDGIRDYTDLIARAVSDLGAIVEIHARDDGNKWNVTGGSRRNAEARGGGPIQYDAIILQYNPFMYGRWGFAPWLLKWLLLLRRAAPNTQLVLMVHEAFVPMINWRWTLMGAWQRLQLIGVRAIVDKIIVANAASARGIAWRVPQKPLYHVPVGSNLPDMRSARKEQRESLGASSGFLVVASFGTPNSARLSQYIARACNDLATAGVGVILLNLGAGAERPGNLHPAISVVTPGVVDAVRVARLLSAADIFLSPLEDGVSTRRTTLMAALQHGLPIVGTVGRATDELFFGSIGAISLVPVARADLFSQAVMDLARSPELRLGMGAAARALFERYFCWPRIAKGLVASLGLTLRSESGNRYLEETSGNPASSEIGATAATPEHSTVRKERSR